MINVKLPYTMAAMSAGAASDKDVMIVHAVDEMMRMVRIHQIIQPEMDDQSRNELLRKHVEAAFEYYSTFSPADMGRLMLIEGFIRNGGGENE